MVLLDYNLQYKLNIHKSILTESAYMMDLEWHNNYFYVILAKNSYLVQSWKKKKTKHTHIELFLHSDWKIFSEASIMKKKERLDLC